MLIYTERYGLYYETKIAAVSRDLKRQSVSQSVSRTGTSARENLTDED